MLLALARFLLVAPAVAQATAPAVPQEATRELEVVHLANEGFLLRSGDDAVLIDAFVAEPYSIYAALTPAAADALAGAEPPFDGVDLALTSHVHRDHFQPEIACRFLESSPRTLFVSSPDAVEALRGECEPRIASVYPAVGERDALEVGDVRVEFLRLSHGTGRFAKIQNLGHVVTIGGQKVLHVGDAEADPAVFAPYELATEQLDVALLPYWYWLGVEGRQLIAGLRARHLVAVHVPPKELAEVTARHSAKDVHVFQACLEARRYAPR